MSRTPLKQLPYSKQYRELRRQRANFPFNGWFFLTAGQHAWDWARAWNKEPWKRAFACLPPDTDPSDYSWDIVKGADLVFVVGEPDEDISDLIASHCLAAGAKQVNIHDNRFHNTRYFPERIAAA